MPRGRPKGSKNKPVEISANNSAVLNDQNIVLKKRGRPRKTSSDAIIKEPVMILNANGELVKRGRGRPKKNPQNSDGLIQITESSTEKKKRGRPKKNQTEQEEVTNLTLKRQYNYNVATINDFENVEISKSDSKTSFETMIQNELERIKKVNFKVNSTSNFVSKPNLEFYRDAVEIRNTENGREIILHSKVGDTILIQYPQNWRRTERWIIKTINTETGDIGLVHAEDFYLACTNYIYGPTIYGLKIKKLESLSE